MIRTLALVVVALAGASAASATPPSTVIHLKLPGTTSRYVDLGPKGYSGGDYFLTTGHVVDRATGRRAGRLGGIWTIISRAADNASFDLGLAHGTLIVNGRISHAARQSVLDVAGGTGAYAGARGTVVFRYLSQTTAALDIRLR